MQDTTVPTPHEQIPEIPRHLKHWLAPRLAAVKGVYKDYARTGGALKVSNIDLAVHSKIAHSEARKVFLPLCDFIYRYTNEKGSPPLLRNHLRWSRMGYALPHNHIDYRAGQLRDGLPEAFGLQVQTAIYLYIQLRTHSKNGYREVPLREVVKKDEISKFIRKVKRADTAPVREAAVRNTLRMLLCTDYGVPESAVGPFIDSLPWPSTIKARIDFGFRMLKRFEMHRRDGWSSGTYPLYFLYNQARLTINEDPARPPLPRIPLADFDVERSPVATLRAAPALNAIESRLMAQGILARIPGRLPWDILAPVADDYVQRFVDWGLKFPDNPGFTFDEFLSDYMLAPFI